MKLTERKNLNWSDSLNSDYVFNKQGKKHIKDSLNNSLDQSKAHLGVYTDIKRNPNDSPTFKSKPKGKRLVFDLFKENKPIIVSVEAYKDYQRSGSN